MNEEDEEEEGGTDVGYDRSEREGIEVETL